MAKMVLVQQEYRQSCTQGQIGRKMNKKKRIQKLLTTVFMMKKNRIHTKKTVDSGIYVSSECILSHSTTHALKSVDKTQETQSP